MREILILKYSKLILLGGLRLGQIYDPGRGILPCRNPYENKRY